MNAETRVGWPGWLVFAAVLIGVLMAQSPLIFNPGYFSHDELQWASFASQFPGWHFRKYLWVAVQSFQYRPLTFSLWLWLSEHLFAHPWAFHGVMVALGAINASMLALLMRGFGLGPAPSIVTGLLFALSPYAAYTHGWVGTLGDLIWVGCALSIGLVVRRDRWPMATAVCVLVLTTIALLAKESAVVIPALLGVSWLFLGRRRNWGIAMWTASAPVAAYLALRIGVLLFSPREAVGYDWSLHYIPQRWFEYQLFPFDTNKIEVNILFMRGVTDSRVLVDAAAWLALLAGLWRAGKAWFAAFLLLGFAALGPVLILPSSANQYGYGFAAAASAVCVAAWPHLRRAWRILFVVLALLWVAHTVHIVQRMRKVGQIQAVFSPALARTVADAGGKQVTLPVANPGKRWIYERLTFDIPSYSGVAIGDRVRVVEEGAPADYVIELDGRLTPQR